MNRMLKWGMVVVAVSLAVLSLAAPAMAGMCDMCNFYGTAEVSGVPVDDGTEITAWVDDLQIGSGLTGAGTLDDDQFSFAAEYDGSLGLEVSFKIGELWANETATFVDCGVVEVNLTAAATLELVEGVNIIPYTGNTTDLPEALTNIGPGELDVVTIIWARGAWTAGVWLYYNPAISFGTLSQLENGRAYIIVVTEDCAWNLP